MCKPHQITDHFLLDCILKVATIATMATYLHQKPVVISAKEAKNHFGEVLDTVQRQPVVVTKNGRPVAIMIRYADRSRFDAIRKRIQSLLEKKQR